MFSNYTESGAPLMTDAARKERASFTLTPSHTTLANTLVRVIQSKVPTVGFRTEPPEQSEVHIQENTTPLPNEMLAHRIGMIPISVAAIDDFDPKKYRVELDIANPTQESRMVTTADMHVFVQDAEGWKDLGPEGTAATKRKYTLPAFSQGGKFNFAYADVVELACDFQGNGTATYGTF